MHTLLIILGIIVYLALGIILVRLGNKYPILNFNIAEQSTVGESIFFVLIMPCYLGFIIISVVCVNIGRLVSKFNCGKYIKKLFGIKD